MSQSHTLLHPPHIRLVYATLAVALLFELFAYSVEMSGWIPDLLSLILLYWAINLPSKVNIFTAFFCGLLADITLGVPLGQYAIAYSITTFLVLLRQQQVVMFNLGFQSAIVGALLLCNLIVITLVRLALGAQFIGWAIYFPPLIGAVLWPMLDKLMLWLCQRQKL